MNKVDYGTIGMTLARQLVHRAFKKRKTGESWSVILIELINEVYAQGYAAGCIVRSEKP